MCIEDEADRSESPKDDRVRSVACGRDEEMKKRETIVQSAPYIPCIATGLVSDRHKGAGRNQLVSRMRRPESKTGGLVAEVLVGFRISFGSARRVDGLLWRDAALRLSGSTLAGFMERTKRRRA